MVSKLLDNPHNYCTPTIFENLSIKSGEYGGKNGTPTMFETRSNEKTLRFFGKSDKYQYGMELAPDDFKETNSSDESTIYYYNSSPIKHAVSSTANPPSKFSFFKFPWVEALVFVLFFATAFLAQSYQINKKQIDNLLLVVSN